MELENTMLREVAQATGNPATQVPHALSHTQVLTSNLFMSGCKWDGGGRRLWNQKGPKVGGEVLTKGVEGYQKICDMGWKGGLWGQKAVAGRGSAKQ